MFLVIKKHIQKEKEQENILKTECFILNGYGGRQPYTRSY